MKALLSIACLLLLAACDAAPSAARLPVYVAQATQAVGVAQTQRADRATATAQAITFRATETQLAHAVILSSTQDAAHVFATMQSITATMQSLTQTQIALDRLAGQSTTTAEMWPISARATSAALTLATDDQQAQADRVDILSTILLTFFGGIALFIGAWVVVRVGAAIWDVVEARRHDREMNLLVEDHGAAGNAAAWQTVKPETVVDETQEGIRVQQWQTRIRLFMAAGDKLGFANRRMCPPVLSNRAWGLLTANLIACGVLVKDSDAKIGTRWAAGWDLARGLADLKTIPLPPGEPVDVMWTGNTQRSEHSETLVNAETLERGE